MNYDEALGDGSLVQLFSRILQMKDIWRTVPYAINSCDGKFQCSYLYYYIMESKNKLIGDKIKAIRTKQGLTQDALARKCDIPYATLAKIESNDITKPSIQTVSKIAEGLGISIDDLIK